MRPLWKPTSDRIESAAITRFRRTLGTAFPGEDYESLHAWSLTDREAFWSRLWDFSEVIGEKGRPPYLEDGDRLPAASLRSAMPVSASGSPLLLQP